MQRPRGPLRRSRLSSPAACKAGLLSRIGFATKREPLPLSWIVRPCGRAGHPRLGLRSECKASGSVHPAPCGLARRRLIQALTSSEPLPTEGQCVAASRAPWVGVNPRCYRCSQALARGVPITCYLQHRPCSCCPPDLSRASQLGHNCVAIVVSRKGSVLLECASQSSEAEIPLDASKRLDIRIAIRRTYGAMMPLLVQLAALPPYDPQ